MDCDLSTSVDLVSKSSPQSEYLVSDPDLFRETRHSQLSEYTDLFRQKQQLCQSFYLNALQTKKHGGESFIDPTDSRYFLRSNPPLFAAIHRLTVELFSTLSKFIDYLIVPQSTKHPRTGYFAISNENMEDGFIQPPVVSKPMIDYLLYDIYPYAPFRDYDITSIADIGPLHKDPYTVKLGGQSIEVVPQIAFTNDELQSYLKLSLISKQQLASIKLISIPLSKDAGEAYRDFIQRVVYALLLFVPEGSDTPDYLQMVQQLQSQTFIVRGVEMGREQKFQNAVWWLLSAGTDWLGKREVDLYDLDWAITALLEDEYISRVRSIPPGQPLSEEQLASIRQYGYTHHLLVPRIVADRYSRIAQYVLIQEDMAEWLSKRCDLFAQL